MAMMATKAKLRATLNRLRSLAKVSVIRVSARQASSAAVKTQKTGSRLMRENRLSCCDLPMMSSSVVIVVFLSGGVDGAGYETGYFFG
jgi:hypothetical protein